MKNTFVFWTFLSKEVIDLKKVIESLFENLSLSRDYEDTWEWLEGKSADDIFLTSLTNHAFPLASVFS